MLTAAGPVRRIPARRDHIVTEREREAYGDALISEPAVATAPTGTPSCRRRTAISIGGRLDRDRDDLAGPWANAGAGPAVPRR